ncbi:5ecd5b94-6709-4417-a066-a02da0a0a59e [Thermothielavioides terrestris]|jgi:hypothetical protein|uniref:DUF8021 domain-containing protein n=2 Tax=Thermothielavioides terrestris TaxID=2587410 RepID=G2R8C0_THETT|nr:uncharacterized protein THITE_2051538 [Thermothielavioides terrestris NRRL 8126]AEO68178.1 hypothetical protein THITE_2051538 [Thermothielavioides terrestris NRRL 8126]SPQ24573.1 5ecd5b94-6709-4417-a066-a02da0a0a59e [Thermothielavioides terrestris]
MIPSILLDIGLGFVSHALAACSRETLQNATAAYVQAQTAGNPGLLDLASNVSYAENDTPLDIKQGVLSQPITIDFSRSLHDTVQCATFTELTAATSKHPYVIHTRMLLDNSDTTTPNNTNNNNHSSSQITHIESVVTDAGDWAFNATGHLYWTRRETWDAIAASARDARATIQAAADAYLDEWANTSVAVPLGTPCARLEGGIYSGTRDPAANTCAMPAFPTPLHVGNRRYVIDEELGAVDVFDGFPWIERTEPDRSMPSSNLIRVEKGKIRYIHELTVCATPNCGR